MIEGIDVSAWQGAIDWHRVRAAGKAFAWIKASQVHADPRFAENWSGALSAGMLRGAYHYLDMRGSVAEQARLFLSTYPGGGELPVALDVLSAAPST